MKFLFVCKGNVVRSQMAEAFYNRLSPNVVATSAGTEAQKYENRRLGDYAFFTISCMKEIGYDISECMAKQITPEMVNNADRIIVMADSSTWPDFLRNSRKVEEWAIDDPGGKGYEGHVAARDKVKEHLEKLLGHAII